MLNKLQSSKHEMSIRESVAAHCLQQAVHSGTCKERVQFYGIKCCGSSLAFCLALSEEGSAIQDLTSAFSFHRWYDAQPDA